MDKKSHILQLIPEQGFLPLFFYKDTEVSIEVLRALYRAGIRVSAARDDPVKCAALSQPSPGPVPDSRHVPPRSICFGADFQQIDPSLGTDLVDCRYCLAGDLFKHSPVPLRICVLQLAGRRDGRRAQSL